MADAALQMPADIFWREEVAFCLCVVEVEPTHHINKRVALCNFKNQVMCCPPHRSQTVEQLYYLLFSVGALSFVLATFCTLPYLDEQRSLPLFHFLLRFSAICMVVAEILEIAVNPVPNWKLPLCFIAVLGNILYVCSTYIYEMFNKGELYLMAAFFVSLSAELKVLSIILKDGRLFSTLLKMEMNRLARFGFLIGGSVFFLAGTVILLLQSQKTMSLAAGLTNSLGGLIYSISIYTMFRNDEPIGYKVFDQSIEVPTVL